MTWEALGLNLNNPQIEYGQNWIQEKGLEVRGQIELRDYRDLEGLKSFDKIVSVGMFEHIGRVNSSQYFESA
jgi:cyclopropane-fatty-acyl-phospholipid synthase